MFIVLYRTESSLQLEVESMNDVQSAKGTNEAEFLRLDLTSEVARICEVELYSSPQPACLRKVFAAILVAIENLGIEMHQCVEKMVLQVPNDKGWQAPLLRQATQNLRKRDWYARQERTMTTRSFVTDLVSELADIGVILKKRKQ